MVILECPDDISVPNDPDECGAVVEYEEPANDACGTVTCDYPSGLFFPVGETTVTCTSTAGPECTFTVTVTDEQAPVITTVGPLSMWAPNHQYETFNVSDLVTGVSDNCDASVGVGSVVIAGVSSDEAENASDGGDGNTLNDIVIANDCKSVQLRSERLGAGNGRVYTITLRVTDASNNVSTVTVKVTVPHSQNGAAALDDGPGYTVNGCP